MSDLVEAMRFVGTAIVLCLAIISVHLLFISCEAKRIGDALEHPPACRSATAHDGH